ncbi:hypothetical protein [Burkholderia gladioli]|uniref:hypothetical protein n=1 Tax=Burkholderia gladioli TaxID=28095 RepID=UPI003C7E158C
MALRDLSVVLVSDLHSVAEDLSELFGKPIGNRPVVKPEAQVAESPIVLTPTRPDPLVIDGVSIDIPSQARRVPARETQAFVPVLTTPSTVPAVSPVLPPDTSLMALSLHVRLSNGVEFDLGEASVEELATVIQMLGRLPCSGSTKG